MDLMIEAKDKEQAVFELMRIFKLPKFDTFNDILPYTRADENKPWQPPKKKTPRKKRNADADDLIDEETEAQPPPIVPDDEIAMGGPESRVYWPPGMEEWLRPKKREIKPRDPNKAKSTAEKAAERRAEKAAWQAAREASAEGANVKTEGASEHGETAGVNVGPSKGIPTNATNESGKANPRRAAPKSKPLTKVRKSTKAVLTPSTSDHECEKSEFDDDEKEDIEMVDLMHGEERKAMEARKPVNAVQRPAASRRQSRRAVKKAVRSYAEDDGDGENE